MLYPLSYEGARAGDVTNAVKNAVTNLPTRAAEPRRSVRTKPRSAERLVGYGSLNRVSASRRVLS